MEDVVNAVTRIDQAVITAEAVIQQAMYFNLEKSIQVNEQGILQDYAYKAKLTYATLISKGLIGNNHSDVSNRLCKFIMQH